MSMPLFFVFDLTFNSEFSIYQPSMLLATNEKMDYVYKRITSTNVGALGIDFDLLDKEIKQISAICLNLSTEILLEKYQKGTKKSFLENKAISKLFYENCDYKLNQFLTLIKEKNYTLTIGLKNNSEIYPFKVFVANSNLDSKIKIFKTEVGLQYYFYFKQHKDILPKESQVTILTNTPGWIVLDKQLYFLNAVNGNKLKPFLTKECIAVPDHLIERFFSTFIKDLIKNVTIEADGFAIILVNQITSFTPILVYNFIKDIYFLDFQFYYGNNMVNHSSKKLNFSEVRFENDAIQVYKYERNIELEQEYLSPFVSLGFKKNDLGFLEAVDSNHKMATVELFLNTFEKWRFYDKINGGVILIDNKQMNLKKPTIIQQVSEELDWFDLKMDIIIGEYKIPFAAIIPNIKAKNPFFELPDATFFIIPNDWFQEYESLVTYATTEKDRLKIKKVNKGLLPSNPSIYEPLQENRPAAYQANSKLLATLRPYQIAGIEWLLSHYHNNLGACLADDMGLGKTIQTLALLLEVHDSFELQTSSNDDLFALVEPKKKPLQVLIVLPASLVFNWYQEIKKFTPHFSVLKYVDSKRKELVNRIKNYDIILTTYHIANSDIEKLNKIPFTYLILDESQYIKNKNAKFFKNLSTIQAINRITLTGTPIENSLDDLWSQMQFINPNILGDYTFFKKRYLAPLKKNQEVEVLGELKKITSPFILRRTKEMVLKDLPDISYQTVFCEMTTEQSKYYEVELSKARNTILNQEVQVSDMKIINSLLKLRQLSNHPHLLDKEYEDTSGKFNEVIEYLEMLKKGRKKTLLFSSFLGHIEILTHWCKQQKINYRVLTGQTPMKDREQYVAEFQNNEEVLFFFISLKAGGVGLNLTQASYVLILDPWWNPFAEKQSIARAHRMGQKNNVHVIKFISKNTVEEKILRLQEKKKELSDAVLEEDFLPLMWKENLSYILE